MRLRPILCGGLPTVERFVYDKAEKIDDIDIKHFQTDAMVRSGDYFKALSSMLEMIGYRIEHAAPIQYAEIQQIIEQLEYIDQEYKIESR